MDDLFWSQNKVLIKKPSSMPKIATSSVCGITVLSVSKADHGFNTFKKNKTILGNWTITRLSALC